MVIGRKSSSDLRIPLTSVSRNHCEITVNGDRVQVKDLGSSNGTFHNSERVQEAHLSAGDELVIGPVVFTVVVDGVPDHIKPVRTILNSSMAGASAGLDQTVESAPPAVDGPSGIDATEELDDDSALAALEAVSTDDEDDEFSLLIDEELEDERG